MEESRHHHPYYGRPGSSVEQEQLFSTGFKKRKGNAAGFATIAIQLALPLIAATLALPGSSTAGSTPNRNFLIYAAGFLVATTAYLVSSNLLPVRGYSALKEQFTARVLAGGIDVNRLEGVWVGFSPDAEPRVYLNNYDWDVGFLFVMPDRLCYIGEQAQFALKKEHVVRVRLGPGGPSWFALRRVYVDWTDGAGAIHHMNFRPADALSLRQIAPLSRRLLDRLSRWQASLFDEAAIPSRLAALGSPNTSEVPSRSLRQALSYGRLMLLGFNSLVTSALICFMARLPFSPAGGGQAFYVLGVVLWIWLLQVLPCLARNHPVS